LKFAVIPGAVKVSSTMAAPTRDQITAISVNIPVTNVNALTGTFVITLPCQVWPDSSERIETDFFTGTMIISVKINHGKALHKEL